MGSYVEQARENHVKKKVEEGKINNVVFFFFIFCYVTKP